jgi:hypothetical protein
MDKNSPNVLHVVTYDGETFPCFEALITVDVDTATFTGEISVDYEKQWTFRSLPNSIVTQIECVKKENVFCYWWLVIIHFAEGNMIVFEGPRCDESRPLYNVMTVVYNFLSTLLIQKKTWCPDQDVPSVFRPPACPPCSPH